MLEGGGKIWPSRSEEHVELVEMKEHILRWSHLEDIHRK